MEFIQKVDAYIAECEKRENARLSESWSNAHPTEAAPDWFLYEYGRDIGKVYIRVWRRNKGNELSKSVFCFIDKCGNIYKPSGWAKPTKGIRATLGNPIYNSAGLYIRG